MSGAEWRVEMPALRGSNSRGIRHLESFTGGLEGACYDTIMLNRDSKLGMQNVRRMQSVQRFFIDALDGQRGYGSSQVCSFAKTLIESRVTHCSNRSPTIRFAHIEYE